MDGDQAAHMIRYLLIIALVASALFARRLPLGSVLRMALLWVAIFAALFGLFTLGERAGLFSSENFGRYRARTIVEPPAPAATTRIDGQGLRIELAPDGHYWVEGTVNGVAARFLIDSGATVTALSETTARAAGLNIRTDEPALVMITANGRVEARRSSIPTLAIGPIIVSDLDVVVSPAFGEVNVIGMNLLSRLSSWGVRDRAMVLTP